MKTAKMIIYRLIHPANWILCFLPPFSFAALIFIFATKKEDSATAYPIFVLSAYSLIILIAALPLLAGRLKQVKAKFWNHSRLIKKISSTNLGTKYLNDHLFRSSISIYQGMVVNFAYMLFRFVTAIQYRSVWFFSMAVYYLVLCVMKAHLVFSYRCREQKGSIYEIRCYRRTAGMLFFAEHSHGRYDCFNDTNRFRVYISGVSDLPVGSVHILHDDLVHYKPYQVSENGQPHHIGGKGTELCVCANVRSRFTDSYDFPFFF